MQSIINSVCALLLLLFVRGYNFECPNVCTCQALDASVVCQNKGLTTLPADINPEIQRLDLAWNEFEDIPDNISMYKNIRFLNMSHNKIIIVKAYSLKGLNALEVLDLSHNKFQDWRDIPTGFLRGAPALKELIFSYNTLRGFLDIIVEYPLQSDSVEKLYLTNCSITNLLGDILQDMPNLKELVLANNPITTVNAQIKSNKLEVLDLSNCNLQRIDPNAFKELIFLQDLLLSKNYELKRFISSSKSLSYLDLSSCNLEAIPSSILPNLTKINLEGNHLRRIPGYSFESLPLLQWVDLSNNAIETIDVKAFTGLKIIEYLDLSFNTITAIPFETFVGNPKLHKLNLSRNYLSEVGQLVAESLRWLDMSVCEIRKISRDSLIMMPKLKRLSLSRNFITHIPNRLQADELEVLDFSWCRIYSLNNMTFIAMNSLRSLDLSGNRLTSGVKPSFFHKIKDVELHDNSWYCDCNSDAFRELYIWLIYDKSSTSTLRCRSPENFAGLTWEAACRETWFVSEKPRNDSMWIYSLLLIVLMTLLCCIVMSIRQVYHRKATRLQELQEQQREEARERLRRMNQRSLQASRESMNRNAPDPRELETPPSYAEAVSMTRLNMSCPSLNRSLHSLHSSQPDISRRTKQRRKRRRHRSENKSNLSETQSAASLSHANSEVSLAGSEDEFRSLERRHTVIESNF